MNIQLLEEYVEQGYISKRKHPKYDLWIYNYTSKTQYDDFFNEITLQCRGLVLNKEYDVVARPFKKFFNYEQNRHVPTEDFTIYEKLDGSLGIIFYYNKEWIVATRGSFESEQAEKGRKLLENYNYENLDRNYTYLCEILYKENTIVIPYDKEELVLLGIIETKTGEELDIYNLPFEVDFPKAKVYDGINDFSEIKKMIKDDEEGFVIRFSNNDRSKMKGEEYCRLHRILTGVSNVSIWEYLSENKDFNEILDRVPDEFYQYIKATSKELQDNFNSILEECKNVYKELETRKDTALYFKEQKYPSVLFAMLDKKTNLDKIIWKMVRPVWAKPFNNKEENE